MVLKKAILAAALAVLVPINIPAPLRSQTEAPASVTIPVRVYSGGEFVADLGLQDFVLLENGVPQKVDALYLVDKAAVVRKEGAGDFVPDTSRKFYMLFQLFEYNPKLSEAIHILFNDGLLPGDTLYIQTPMRNYTLSSISFNQKPRDVLAKEMDGIVRRDITQGGLLYKSQVRELKRFVQSIAGTNPMAGGNEDSGESASLFGLEYLLGQYRDSLAKMESLRNIDENKIIDFARALKQQPGQKFIYYIYQREFRPEISPTIVTEIISENQENQNVLSDVQELFQFYRRNVSLDPAKIINAFTEASVDFNFLFMGKTPESVPGIVMREQSEDIFKLYSRVAQATGGIIDNSQNPASAVKDTLKMREKCYLLVFTPSPGPKDGTFKPITVQVKDKDYKVVSRQGYVLN
jgi:hypothetical protein